MEIYAYKFKLGVRFCFLKQIFHTTLKRKTDYEINEWYLQIYCENVQMKMMDALDQ